MMNPVKNKPKSIHTSRTMMYEELSRLMSHRVFDVNQIVELNILKKRTKKNLATSVELLSHLYDFKNQNELWKVFDFLWNIANDHDRRLLTLLYALKNDDLLRLSIPVVLDTPPAKKVQVSSIQEVIEKDYPEQYSANTLLSTSQNIASSWKQAGYIIGKVSNIRFPVRPGFVAIVFALYLGKIDGLYGESLLKTTWIKVFGLSESSLKSLLSEAAIRDLITYNHAGGVVAINFDKLLNQIKQ